MTQPRSVLVPDGMITAAQKAIDYKCHSGDVDLRACLAAALAYAMEHPRCPEGKDLVYLRDVGKQFAPFEATQESTMMVASEWSRREFLGPAEPETLLPGDALAALNYVDMYLRKLCWNATDRRALHEWVARRIEDAATPAPAVPRAEGKGPRQI